MSQTSLEQIKYSPQSIRWIYGDNTAANLANLSQITKWLTSLHEKSVEMRCITGIQEINSLGAWQPIPGYPIEIEIFEIHNPQILDDDLTFKGSSKIDRIQKIECLDFDPTQNQLVVNLAGDLITENPDTQPKTVVSKNYRKYVFLLQ